MTKTALLAALLAGAALPLAAQPAARAPGIGTDDPRGEVDMAEPPWNAIVKVQTNLANSCTGALVAPTIVLTAAHCLYNPRTRRMLQAESLHVLFGYRRGEYASHRTVARYVAGGDWPGPVKDDWVLLVLAPGDLPAHVAPLALSAEPMAPGDAVAMAGFSQDRRHVLLADRACRVTGTGPLLRHDCSGTFGTSGAPVLARRGPQWKIVGVTSALAADGTKLAVPAAAVRDALKDLGAAVAPR